MGWLRELPDFRDYSLKTDMDQVSASRKMKGVTKSIKDMAAKAGINKTGLTLPTSVNLTPWFSPVEDQGSLGSCTANAGVGILEYFERRAFGKHIDASRLFLYKATRDLLHWTGDTGAYLRTTMEAMTVFGVPPEEFWPYKITAFDIEPTAFCFSFAQNYQAISYFRLDPSGVSPGAVLNMIKTCLAAGIPSMFGFTCYNSLYQANATGKIPYPTSGEYVIGGHAIVAAGYDENIEIINTNTGEKTTGAFLIRNSWGTSWGNNGYGWLPFKYVTEELATDWWCMLRAEWINTGIFKV
jgi:C1A family cysteine protease